MNPSDILRKTPLFSCLNEGEISKLADVALEREYPKGRIVIREGDTSTSLYVMLGGAAKAVSTNDSGKTIVLNVFNAGDYFGEMSFIDGEPRSATVETTEPSQMLVIPGAAFREIVYASPEISFRLMKGLSSKIRHATTQIEDLVFIVAHQELYDAHLDTINRLVMAAEFKDDNTGDHIARVSEYSALMAEKCGYSEEYIRNIRYAAPMHDIGKIGIPEHILRKPGKLTEDEFRLMKTHTTIGAKILSNPRSDILKMAYEIALCHHEKFDGTGYPRALRGKEIPEAARIVSLADTFDALVSSRCYKSAYPVETALEIIKKERGAHFAPDLTDVFMDSIDDMVKIRDKYSPDDAAGITWSERDAK